MLVAAVRVADDARRWICTRASANRHALRSQELARFLGRRRPAARHPGHPRRDARGRRAALGHAAARRRAAGAGSRPRGWRRRTRGRWSPAWTATSSCCAARTRGPAPVARGRPARARAARRFLRRRAHRARADVRARPASALDALLRLLAPGGRFVLFELDYGATILAPCGGASGVVRRAERAAGRLAPAAARRPPAPAAAGRARRARPRRASPSRSRSTSRSGGGSSTPRWRRSPTPSCWPTSTRPRRRR